MFIQSVPQYVEWFLILYPFIYLCWSFIIRNKKTFLLYVIFDLIAILYLWILYGVIVTNDWKVTSDGTFRGAINLLSNKNYKDFFERYLELLAFFVVYISLGVRLLTKILKFVRKDLFKILVLSFICILFLIVFGFTTSSIRVDFGLWTEALIFRPENWDSLLYFIVSFLFLPEAIIFLIMLFNLRKSKKQKINGN